MKCVMLQSCNTLREKLTRVRVKMALNFYIFHFIISFKQGTDCIFAETEGGAGKEVIVTPFPPTPPHPTPYVFLDEFVGAKLLEAFPYDRGICIPSFRTALAPGAVDQEIIYRAQTRSIVFVC